jgi:hypothetical protein
MQVLSPFFSLLRKKAKINKQGKGRKRRKNQANKQGKEKIHKPYNPGNFL